MSGDILLLDESCDLDLVRKFSGERYRAVVCWFWASPDFQEELRSLFGAECMAFPGILGNLPALEREAFLEAERICSGGPRHRGLPLRRYLMEQAYRACLDRRIAVATLDRLSAWRRERNLPSFRVVAILTPGNRDLFAAARSRGPDADGWSWEEHPATDRVSLGLVRRTATPLRWWRHLRATLLTGDWRLLAGNLAEKIDARGAWQRRAGRLLPRIAPDGGGVTFFSSYLNNSRILAAFEPLMPRRVSWLVTNLPARRGARAGQGEVRWLWRFAPAETPAAAQPDRPDSGAQDGEGGIWREWQSHLRTALEGMTRSWEEYLDRSRPALVVIANQWGIEGWLGDIARKRGIPVAQVMHGVLGGHLFVRTPLRSDIMIAPGEFWKRLWPAAEQEKIILANPEGYVRAVGRRVDGGKRRLTFFSWPMHKSALHYNFSEFADAFASLFRNLLAAGDVEITVRLHPLEHPGDFRDRWKRRFGKLPPGLRLDKEEPLSHLLAGTDVALMFRSTVMLDCLASGIPVVLPGWVDFGWDADALKDLSGVHPAADLKDLESTLAVWLAAPPAIERSGIRRYALPAGEGVEPLKEHLRRLADQGSRR